VLPYDVLGASCVKWRLAHLHSFIGGVVATYCIGPQLSATATCGRILLDWNHKVLLGKMTTAMATKTDIDEM
jgi:hypothetical protein